jgi:hypothetical protein
MWYRREDMIPQKADSSANKVQDCCAQKPYLAAANKYFAKMAFYGIIRTIII